MENRPSGASDWRQLTTLGEELLNDGSLSAQHDRIVARVAQLIRGKVALWLDESMFRLPDWDEKRLFPAQPPLDGMKRAIKANRPQSQKIVNGKTASRGTYSAVPLENHGLILGAIQVTRLKGPRFSSEELEHLQSLAQIVSVSLLASHRVEVERFRLRQLNLVREVSAQIAHVLNVDELARRVTELIQKTFRYYYVAIFTLKPNSKSLRFRSSASTPRRGKKKASIALEVELGQGLIGETAARGEQIVVDDVRADPRYRYIDRLPETRSEVTIPLKIEDHVLGVLDVQSDKPHAFHPNDLLILNALADNVARAVESAHLYSTVRHRADQLTLVAEVSKSVTSTLNLSTLMNDAAALIHERFRYPYVSLFTVHRNRRLIQYEAGSGKRSAKLAGYTIPLYDGEGMIPWVARNGQTVLSNDVTKDERYRPSPLPPKNTRSELTVPLIFNETVVGILDIQSDRQNAFTEDDRVMFEAVGDTMAAAIRNADLYSTEQWRRQVADSLREVAGLLSANVGVEQVLDTILTELERILPTELASVWLLNEGELYPAAVHGCCDLSELAEARHASADAAVSMISALVAEAPLIRKPTDPIGPAGLAAAFASDYSSIAAPLRIGDQPVGVLTLAHSMPGRYGHEAQNMVTTFASYAAVAIENARLYDAAQEQAYASAALLQVAQAVVSMNDLDEILSSIIRIMPILVGIQRVALYLWDSERESFFASQQYGFFDEESEELTEREFQAGEFPMLDIACGENRIVSYPLMPGAEVEYWPEIQPEAEDEADFQDEERLLMAVPLSIKNDLFGVMLVEEAEDGRRFRARRIEIITGIAQQAALAIQNDRLQQAMVVRERLETEAQLARQIQQTFIPDTLPQYEGWQFAARWRTARQVGGDFYDVFELPNRRLGLFIADVADKGMPAALFMALTRTLMRAAVIETDSPAEALTRVNDLLLPDTQQGMFVTAAYVVVDLKRGELTYVNAGHNPPLWMKRSGEIERLTRTGVALGVMEQPNMTQRTISLEPGESLLLYTDGLTESFNSEGGFYGEERLLERLKFLLDSPAEELLSSVEAHLNEFTDPMPPADDMTMMAVKRIYD
ncbi:MAG: GAF domain-containing protein [Chloroflexota bacterium]